MIILDDDHVLYSKKEANSGLSYISRQRIEQLTIEVRKNGGAVIINEPWFNERLEKNNASAATYDDVLVFGPNVTVSDVLEETHHFMQNKAALNIDKPEPLRTYLNEIDAKKHLLEVKDKYKIPRIETELTQKQLKSYEQLRDSYLERSDLYDDQDNR